MKKVIVTKEELQQREDRYNELATIVADLKRENELFEKETQEKQKHLEDVRANMEAMDKKESELKVRVEALEAQVKSLEANKEALTAEGAKINATNSAVVVALADNTNKVEELGIKIVGYNKDISAIREEAKQIDASLKERKKILDTYEEELKIKEGAVARRERLLSDKSKT